jgi:twitching motility protein PilT
LIESFPADEQGVMRNMISESLRGVISQQLIPRKDGTGVVPAFEVLIVTPAVSNMIRKDEMHQLPSAMTTGRAQGMILFDDSLMGLVKSDIITGEEAYARANEKEQFKQFLSKKKSSEE